MATSSTSLLLLHLHPSPLVRHPTVRCLAVPSSSSPPPLLRRRQSLLLLLSLPAPLLAGGAPASAADIPLFGIRKKLAKIEEAAEEAVKEGEKAVEEGIAVAEKEIAAGGVEFAVAGDLVQAGAVAGAEAVGVLVGLSVVNGILGPEGQKSE
ncbi:uncharacterized protein [Typha latifolia]|uniref:uncharacterized protein n=1 Tax=Typha latifolia TaxID=4733 RepID=UPI003C301004